MSKPITTVIRLARAIECDGRVVDSVVFAGEPGSEIFPVNAKGSEFEIDALEIQSMIARRTGLSRPAIERLSPIDFMSVAFALFLPRKSADVVSIDERRKKRS